MMVIRLLLLLYGLIVTDNTVRRIQIFLLGLSCFLQDLLHLRLMMHIGLCKLTAHGLIKIRSIVHIICLRVFQLRKRPAEFIKLRFKGSVHLLQESVCDLFYRILLTACHRRNKYVKRIVHFLESGVITFSKLSASFTEKSSAI